MYAIVSIAGQQFKVEKGKKVFVHKLPGEVGEEVSFNKVLLISNDEKVNVGAPYLSEAVVVAQIVSQLRGDKVLVFKKKRRKGYQKLNGHRQYFTEILIEDIAETGVQRVVKKKAAELKAEAPPEIAAPVVKVEKAAKPLKAEKTETPKASPKKATPKTVSEEKPKKAPAKKAAAPAEKKPAAKKPAAKGESKAKK
jgi:large subunit ribosomal protein L21